MKHRKTAAVALFALLICWSYAHGPELEIDKASAAPGERITVSGEGITSNGDIRLVLQGVVANYPLGTFQGDQHGRFEAEVTLPLDLQPGKYTLIASGENRATARLEIQSGERHDSAAEHTEESEGHADDHEEAHTHGEAPEEPHARADALEIERSSSALETTLAWVAVLGSAVLGLTLLVSSRGD